MASSGNFATMNPLVRTTNSMVYTFGNLRTSPGSSWSTTTWARGNMVIPSDKKIYFEVLLQTQQSTYSVTGIGTNLSVPSGTNVGGDGSVTIYNDGKYVNGSYTGSLFSAQSAGTIMQVAVDGATRKVWLGYNNTWIGSGDPANGTNEAGTVNVSNALGYDLMPVGQNNSAGVSHYNFGQDSTFAGEKSAGGNADGNGFGDFAYAPPTGFLALCSANLSISSDIDPAETNDDISTELCFTAEYTGNLTNRTISVDNYPDLLMIRHHTHSQNWYVVDSARGILTNEYIRTDQSDSSAVFPQTNFTSVSSSAVGISSGTWLNSTGSTYQMWMWRCAGGVAQNKTYAVTVVSDSGNKYRMDGHGTSSITLDVNEGSTITFDLSDSTVDGHPLLFSETTNGTHNSGTTYETGVVYKLDGVVKTKSEYVDTTAFNAATTRETIITVAASAPTLHYYCNYHSGMGGQINTNATSAGIGNSHTEGDLITNVQTNSAAGMSIIRYVGDGGSSNITYAHGLGAKPQYMWWKDRDTNSNNENWGAWHHKMGDDKYMYLNSNVGQQSSTNGVVNTGAITTTTIGFKRTSSTGGSMTSFQSGHDYVVYAWTGVEGFSKFDHYNGNGNSDGPFVYTGFRPRFIIIKNMSGTSGWTIIDTTQYPVNTDDGPPRLELDTNAAAVTGSSATREMDLLSNGFKIRSTNSNINTSGSEYNFAAWGENPFKYQNAR